MKKIVRLTESELNDIIKKVINEQMYSDPSKNVYTPPKPESKPTENVNLKPVGIDTKSTQDFLMALGYDLGPKGADGYMGEFTQKAIMQFQQDNGKAPSGTLTLDQYKLLQSKANQEGNMPKTDNVKQYQQALVDKGYKIKVDGLHGPKTAAAVKDFQSKHQHLKPTGYFDPATVKQLLMPQGAGKGALLPQGAQKPNSATAAKPQVAQTTPKKQSTQPFMKNEFM